MPRLIFPLAAIWFLSLFWPIAAKDFRLTATGNYVGTNPSRMGIGFNFANENSNPYIWLNYLGANAARVFIQPMVSSGSKKKDRSVWRTYAGNVYDNARAGDYGDQFGVSFDGQPAVDQDSWLGAVQNLRQSSGNVDFFDWLFGKASIDWETFISGLNTTGTGISLAQLGNPQEVVRRLNNQVEDLIGVWDVRCRNFNYTSTDRANPEYWKERWETYRLIYIGGRWMAKNSIRRVELYNEPDKDEECLDTDRWIDDMRIRSQGFQDAYADHNAASGSNVELVILGGPTAVGWADAYSAPAVRFKNTPFPSDVVDPNWNLMNEYAFHKYGSFSKNQCTEWGPNCKSENGISLRNSYDSAKGSLKKARADNLPVTISELNCFTAATAEPANRTQTYFLGRHVMDLPSTAACLASQIAGLVTKPDGPDFISVHKMVQNLVSFGSSKIGKNGLFYAHITALPLFITSSTKSAEAYRLILRRSINQQVMGFNPSGKSNKINNSKSRTFVWGVDDDKAYYIFVSNEDYDDNNIVIDLGPLQFYSGSFATITAVAQNPALQSTYHGEVAAMPQIVDAKLSMVVPAASFYAATIPKVPTQRLAADATEDATVSIDDTNRGSDPSLSVSSAEAVSVAVLKFDVNGQVGDKGIVSAAIQLNLERSNNDIPQLFMVLAIQDKWNEDSVSWSKLATLRGSVNGPLYSTADNFILWRSSNPPIVAGHVTVPPGQAIPPEGVKLALDVTDIVKKDQSVNFLVVRMFRYDKGNGDPPLQVPADELQGTAVFTSRESDNVDNRPKLLVDYEVDVPSPPPAPIPSPPPPVPSPSPSVDANAIVDQTSPSINLPIKKPAAKKPVEISEIHPPATKKPAAAAKHPVATIKAKVPSVKRPSAATTKHPASKVSQKKPAAAAKHPVATIKAKVPSVKRPSAATTKHPASKVSPKKPAAAAKHPVATIKAKVPSVKRPSAATTAKHPASKRPATGKRPVTKKPTS